MDLRDLNIKIPNTRSHNSVTINTEYWIANTSNMIVATDKKGRVSTNYITPVLDENLQSDIFKKLDIKKGDVILISKIGANMSSRVFYQLPMSTIKYGNIHASQLIGKFELGFISLEALTPFTNYVVCKETKVSTTDIITTGEHSLTVVGEVIKCSSKKYNDKITEIQDSEINIGDKILIVDNTTTNIMLNSEQYICTAEERVVGKFKEDIYTLEYLEPLEDVIILSEYKDDKIEGSSLLFAPIENLDFDDATSNYNRDKFVVEKVGKNITFLKNGDIIYSNRDVTNYITIDGKRYFTLNGLDYVDAKVI